MTVADYCGRLVEQVLKLSRSDFLDLPNTDSSLQKIIACWNRNVLVMGDFNDEPFNRSILGYLLSSRDRDHVEEQVKASGGRKIPTPKVYLQLEAYLFNCMWPLLGQPDVGTLYYSGATNSMNLLDQFMISRGLLFGEAKLMTDLAFVKTFTPTVMTSPKKRPIPFDRKIKKGYSDHFPIEPVVRTM
jgi:hypothetical protein